MGAPRLNEGKSVSNERLDLFLSKEIKQCNQILSKERRLEPLEPLNAVGENAFPPREKPSAGDVPSEDRDLTKSMAATFTT